MILPLTFIKEWAFPGLTIVLSHTKTHTHAHTYAHTYAHTRISHASSISARMNLVASALLYCLFNLCGIPSFIDQTDHRTTNWDRNRLKHTTELYKETYLTINTTVLLVLITSKAVKLKITILVLLPRLSLNPWNRLHFVAEICKIRTVNIVKA